MIKPLNRSAVSVIFWVGFVSLFHCIPRDNPYDPANPDFVMPHFFCTIELRDETNAGIGSATVIYSYENAIDTVFIDSGESADIRIEKNTAAIKITVQILSITAPSHRLDEPFEITLLREGNQATVYLHNRGPQPVPWDTLKTRPDTAGINLVWHASNAELFSFYRLVRINRTTKDTDTMAVFDNNKDTVFFDGVVDENTEYLYRIHVVSTEGICKTGDEYRVTASNRSPSPAVIVKIEPDFFLYLRLTWRSNADDDFSRYTMYRSADGKLFDSVYVTGSREDTVWLDTTIDEAASRYFYYLSVIDAGGLSSVSDTVSEVNRTAVERSLVYVHEGPFVMGRNGDGIPLNQQPAHTVMLSSFLIDRYEVTVGRFAEFLNAGNGSFYSDSMAAVGIKKNGSLFLPDSSRLSYPMVWLSWSDADTFCRWEGGHLPTEAQWEKAARGSDRRIYPWGSSFYLNQHPTDFFLANYITGYIPVDDSGYSNDGARYTAPVGNYAAGISLYDLYDMAGNASEWSYDWYANEFPADSIDPEGPELGLWRSYRGGSYKNYPEELMATYRFRYDPTARKDDLGCRCAYKTH